MKIATIANVGSGLSVEVETTMDKRVVATFRDTDADMIVTVRIFPAGAEAAAVAWAQSVVVK